MLDMPTLLTRVPNMSVNLNTVRKWKKDLDSHGEWIEYDESGGKVIRIFCSLCFLGCEH